MSWATNAWHKIDNPNTLGILGDVAGMAIGGPWGAALGGALGSELGGGSARHSLGMGALGLAGGYAMNAMGLSPGVAQAGGANLMDVGTNLMAGSEGFAPAAAGGGIWGAHPLLGLLGFGSGLGQYVQGRQLAGMAGQADPYAASRAQYLKQLQALQRNPSSIVNTPGYQAGLEAVQRTLAAQGYTGSGKAMAELAKYGGDAYTQRVQQLATLANMGDPTAPARIMSAGLGSQATGLEQMGAGLGLAFL